VTNDECRLERCADGAARREFAGAAPHRYLMVGGSERRRGPAGLFNWCVSLFMLCMISLKNVVKQLVLVPGLQNSIVKSQVFRFLKIT